jgi:hypothetical protein
VSSLTESIQVLAEKNAALEAEIVNLGTLNNILTAKKTVAANIKDGLRGLKDEGWLSDKEHDELLQRIA